METTAMTDTDIENVYKSALPTSHYAGLRAVYDAGYFDGTNANVDPGSGDPSLTAPPPPVDETVTTP
jgi:hypothetical protein